MLPSVLLARGPQADTAAAGRQSERQSHDLSPGLPRSVAQDFDSALFPSGAQSPRLGAQPVAPNPRFAAVDSLPLVASSGVT